MLVRRRTRNFLLVKRSSNLHPEGLQLLGELFGFNLRITLKFFTFLRSLFSSLNRSSLPSFLPQSVIMQEVELCAMPEHNIYSLFLHFCRVYIIIFILLFSFKLSAQTSLLCYGRILFTVHRMDNLRFFRFYLKIVRPAEFFPSIFIFSICLVISSSARVLSSFILLVRDETTRPAKQPLLT